MARITVIVPVYKVEHYLDRCVKSILAQSFPDFDLVLVDDGSPDTCPQLCDAYEQEDSRIVVIHKRNGGLSDARNAGIDWAMEHSDSEWLAFVDSDDYLHPEYLRKLYDAAICESADLVICDYVKVDDQERIIDNNHAFPAFSLEDKTALFSRLFSNWRIVPAWNKLYHKHIFRKLRFAFGKIHEDEFAIHHVLFNCEKAVTIRDGLYYYRARNNSIMATETVHSRLDGLEAFTERLEFLDGHHVMNSSSLPFDYLYDFQLLKKSMTREERKRYRALIKRCAKVYFKEPANRKLKGFCRFYLFGLYRRFAKSFRFGK